MKKNSTIELTISVVENRDKIFEVSLNNGVFNATHFLSFGGRKIHDMGIDSQEVTWSPSNFISFYSHAYWKIDQIVRMYIK